MFQKKDVQEEEDSGMISFESMDHGGEESEQNKKLVTPNADDKQLEQKQTVLMPEKRLSDDFIIVENEFPANDGSQLKNSSSRMLLQNNRGKEEKKKRKAMPAEKEEEEEDEEIEEFSEKKETKSQVKARVKESKIGTKAWMAKLCFLEITAESFECQFCHQVKKVPSPSNVSNLVGHLEKVHKKEWNRLQTENKKGNADGFVKTLYTDRKKIELSKQNSQPSLKNWLLDNEISPVARVKLSFLIWLIDSQIAFNPVDSKHFERFKNQARLNLDSSFVMKQSAATLRNMVQRLAEARLQKCPAVSVSADLWTSTAAQKYIVGTYHGVDQESMELVHHVLDLVPIFGSAMGDLIASVLEQRIQSHCGKSRLGALIFDSGSNMLNAGKGLRSFGVHSCFAHGLKGVVEAVCGEEPKLTEKHLHCESVALDLKSVKAVANVMRLTGWLRDEVFEDEDLVLSE